MLCWLLFACDGAGSDRETGGDSVDTGADTGDGSAGTDSGWGGGVAEADVVVVGEASSATGGALFRGPDSDGDGAESVWISAYFRSVNCRFEGQTGTVGLVDAPLCIRASGSSEYLGYAIASDGNTVAMGAIGGASQGSYTGTVYLFDEALVPGVYDETAAFAQLFGEAQGDYAGMALAWVGDTDGDGSNDLLIGAPSNDDNGAGSGKAYLFSGAVIEDGTSLSTAPTEVWGSSATAPSKHGAPEAGDGVGSVLNGAGDVNGDGLSDVLLGCNGADDAGTDAGLAALFYGPLGEGDFALRDAPVVWTGEKSAQYVGDFVDGVGDADGDGYGDVAISGDMAEAGRVWILPGPGWSGSIATAPASFGGENLGDYMGASLAGAGDVDGDGRPDVVIGAYGGDQAATDAGAVFVFLSPFSVGDHGFAEAAGSWFGLSEGDGAGRQVEAGGDYNGDGLGDLAIGAPYNDGGGPFSGAAYLVFGAAR